MGLLTLGCRWLSRGLGKLRIHLGRSSGPCCRCRWPRPPSEGAWVLTGPPCQHPRLLLKVPPLASPASFSSFCSRAASSSSAALARDVRTSSVCLCYCKPVCCDAARLPLARIRCSVFDNSMHTAMNVNSLLEFVGAGFGGYLRNVPSPIPPFVLEFRVRVEPLRASMKK